VLVFDVQGRRTRQRPAFSREGPSPSTSDTDSASSESCKTDWGWRMMADRPKELRSGILEAEPLTQGAINGNDDIENAPNGLRK
jgi:hypothetical protein